MVARACSAQSPRSSCLGALPAGDLWVPSCMLQQGVKYGTSSWCELYLSREKVVSHLLVMLKQMCCGDAFKFTWFENWRRERNSLLRAGPLRISRLFSSRAWGAPASPAGVVGRPALGPTFHLRLDRRPRGSPSPRMGWGRGVFVTA